MAPPHTPQTMWICLHQRGLLVPRTPLPAAMLPRTCKGAALQPARHVPLPLPPPPEPSPHSILPTIPQQGMGPVGTPGPAPSTPTLVDQRARALAEASLKQSLGTGVVPKAAELLGAILEGRDTPSPYTVPLVAKPIGGAAPRVFGALPREGSLPRRKVPFGW